MQIHSAESLMRWEVTNEIWKIVHKLMLLLVYVDAAVVVGCLVLFGLSFLRRCWLT